MSEKVLVGKMPYEQALRLRSKLAERGVAVDTAHNGATCNKGCSIELEVWCPEADLQELVAVLKDDQERTMAGLDFDPSVVGATFDVSLETATCPACATEFSTSLRQCPDCGLSFAIPNHLD